MDAVAVEVGQNVAQREGEVVECEAGHAAQVANDGALFVRGPPPQVRGTRGVVLAILGPRLRHLRMVSVLTPERLASIAGGLGRARDLGAHGGGGTGIGMDVIQGRTSMDRSTSAACR